MPKLGKLKWRREHEREHYLYVLSLKCEDIMIEPAGVEWAYSNSDGGWRIAQIGSTIPLKDGWCSVDKKLHKTAAIAKYEAEKLLVRILKMMEQLN